MGEGYDLRLIRKVPNKGRTYYHVVEYSGPGKIRIITTAPDPAQLTRKAREKNLPEGLGTLAESEEFVLQERGGTSKIEKLKNPQMRTYKETYTRKERTRTFERRSPII